MPEEAVETPALAPQVTTEEIRPGLLRVTIEISSDKIAELLDQRYQKLNEMVTLPGFRRGHAPRILLERKLGTQVLQDLRDDLISDGVQQVLKEKKINPIADPELPEQDSIVLKPGSPFRFSVQVEVMPQVEVTGYRGLKVKKIKLEVTPADIDRRIEELRAAKSWWEPREGEARMGDQVIADLDVTVQGKRVMLVENREFELDPRVVVFGHPEPEFCKIFVGKKRGETASYSFHAHSAHPIQAIADQDVTIQATIKGLRERKMPDVDAAFLKEFDCETAEELRQEVARSLSREKEAEAKTRMLADLLEQLVTAHPVSISDALVQRWAAQMPSSELRPLVEAGREGVANLRLAIHQQLLLDKIAEKERIFVTEEEVRQEIDAIGRARDLPGDVLAALKEDPSLLRWVRRRMRANRAMERLLDLAVVEE